MADAPIPQAQAPNPNTKSGDYQAMIGYWEMSDAILGGAPSMRDAGRSRQEFIPGPPQPVAQLGELQKSTLLTQWNESPYLPKLPNESAIDYDYRRRNAPFTNIYQDISDNLAAKPFAKDCALADDEPDDLKELSQNIDGQGHNLHVFARETFKAGIDKGVDWILIDYVTITPGATLADERAIGARPYWVRIPANRMLAVYSDFINGQETIYHARIYEPAKKTVGYDEQTVERVRVLNRAAIVDDAGKTTGYESATWEVWEKVPAPDKSKDDIWLRIADGPFTIGIIPLVPFIPVGRVDGSWRVKPALSDIAYMQVEELQQESNLKYVKEMNAFAMLALIGVASTNPDGTAVKVPVGPKGVIIIPPGQDRSQGDAKFIEPTAASMTFLQTDLEKHRTEMRNLGRQPLASANLTVITTANVSMKAHSAVQAWALLLKDSLEQAWIITCKWLGQDLQPEVNVHVDFGVDLTADTELPILQAARTAKDLSQRTWWDELKRRGVLSDDFDPDAEEEALAEEQQGMDLTPEVQIDPVTGQPIPPPLANNNPPPPGIAPKQPVAA